MVFQIDRYRRLLKAIVILQALFRKFYSALGKRIQRIKLITLQIIEYHLTVCLIFRRFFLLYGLRIRICIVRRLYCHIRNLLFFGKVRVIPKHIVADREKHQCGQHGRNHDMFFMFQHKVNIPPVNKLHDHAAKRGKQQNKRNLPKYRVKLTCNERGYQCGQHGQQNLNHALQPLEGQCCAGDLASPPAVQGKRRKHEQNKNCRQFTEFRDARPASGQTVRNLTGSRPLFPEDTKCPRRGAAQKASRILIKKCLQLHRSAQKIAHIRLKDHPAGRKISEQNGNRTYTRYNLSGHHNRQNGSRIAAQEKQQMLQRTHRHLQHQSPTKGSIQCPCQNTKQ